MKTGRQLFLSSKLPRVAIFLPTFSQRGTCQSVQIFSNLNCSFLGAKKVPSHENHEHTFFIAKMSGLNSNTSRGENKTFGSERANLATLEPASTRSFGFSDARQQLIHQCDQMCAFFNRQGAKLMKQSRANLVTLSLIYDFVYVRRERLSD